MLCLDKCHLLIKTSKAILTEMKFEKWRKIFGKISARWKIRFYRLVKGSGQDTSLESDFK